MQDERYHNTLKGEHLLLYETTEVRPVVNSYIKSFCHL